MTKQLQSLTFAFFVLLLAWVPAEAVTMPDSAFDRFMMATTGANQQTVTFGGNGTPVLANASANLALEADGSLYSTRTATVPNPAGNPLALTAKAKVGAAAVGALAIKALPFVAYLGTGIALYDFFKGLGYDTSVGSDGAVSIAKQDPSVCSTAPCYEYLVNGIWGRDPLALLNAWRPLCLNSVSATGYYSYVAAGTSVNSPIFQACSPAKNGTWGPSTRREVAPITGGISIGLQQLADEIAAKSGWPSGSQVAEAVKQAQELTGETVKTEAPSVTGPATTQGKPEVSTETNADGSTKTTTKQTVYNHNYSGPLVTTTATTTTSVQSCTGAGACSTSSTVTVSQPSPVTEPPATPETCGLPGKPVCAVKIDETGTKKTVPETQFKDKVEQVKTSQEQGLETLKSPSDKVLFTGWDVFFNAPAPVACSPFQLPEYKGVSMGALDPCPVVNGMRTVMAYIWAVGGLFLCLGMVRQSIQGG